MTKSKRTHLPVAFLSLTPEDREVMERAASIASSMEVPLAHLLPAQRVVDMSQDIENGPGRGPGAQDDELVDDNDTRDSGSEEEIIPWNSSAADFSNFYEDIANDYEHVNLWGHNLPVVAPATATTQASAGTSDTLTESSAVYGYPIQPASWNLARPDLNYSSAVIGTLVASSTALATSAFLTDTAPTSQHKSWEIIEKPQSPQPLQPSQTSQLSDEPHSQERRGVGGHPASMLPPRNSGDEHPSGDVLRFVSVHPLQPQAISRAQPRGPFQDRERQEETSRTRGLKACVRCRMQKIRCSIDEDNPRGICRTCMTVSNKKVHYLPCLRYRLTECTLYRTGKAPGLEFTFRWPVMRLKDITDWESSNLRTVLIKSDVCDVPFKLVVRRFIPIPHKDSVHRSWLDYRNGVKKFKETTPYAVVNMKNAVQDMKKYIAENVFGCMDYFLRGSDQLVKETYGFARRYMQRVESDEEKKLLGNFFHLWFAIRRTATTEHIVGEDTLDMEPETKDESYPLFGKIPLPPVMIQQLDMVLTLGILEPLRKQVLEDFQKLALATNPRNWMTIYLVTFLSLHDCAKITAENYQNARKHGLLRRYAIPNFIAERHHSANVFLSHYHYRTESSNPFKQDWKRRHMTPFSYMSVDDIQFLERTKVLLKEREDVIKINREMDLYEHELYFVSQMFEESWQPKETIIDRTDGTVNDVGLKRYVGDAQGESQHQSRPG